MLRALNLRGSGRGAIGFLILGLVALAAIVALQVTGAVAGLQTGAVPASSSTEAAPCSEELLSVPALSAWGSVVMAILMLASSSFAMYGGNIAKRRNTVGTQAVVQPGGGNPVATRPTGELHRRERSAKRREANLRREQQRRSRMHSNSSRSKKRRAGPGCRGPLRKT